MITMHLARLLGGDLLFGLMSAVAFSTILAVVAGLTISISSATSHDLVLGVRNGRALSEWAEVAVFRLAAFVTSALGIALAILFQKENITFLILMAQTVAASTTFPLLILAIYWRGLTATAAIAMGLFGLVTSFSCYMWLLRVAPPSRVATYAFVNPMVAVLLGWAVAGETLNAGTLAAMALVVVAVAVTVTAPRPQTRNT